MRDFCIIICNKGGYNCSSNNYVNNVKKFCSSPSKKIDWEDLRIGARSEIISVQDRLTSTRIPPNQCNKLLKQLGKLLRDQRRPCDSSSFNCCATEQMEILL